MLKKTIKLLFPLLGLLLIFWTKPHATYAATLKIAQLQNNEICAYSLTIGKVNKLAGIKLTLHYDKSVMKFESAIKGTPFNSFMHVINDKNPGELIVVLASANGISGLNLPLYVLNFTRQHSNNTLDINTIKLTECQLMNDTLQEIECSTPEQTTNI